jgi:hypothetical protein
MDERDLEAEQPLSRKGLDEPRARRLELLERASEVLRAKGHVVHPWTTTGQEAPDGRVGAGWAHQLEATLADEQRCGLNTLLDERLAMLEARVEEALVRGDGLVEVDDRDAEVVDAARPHPRDAIRGPA